LRPAHHSKPLSLARTAPKRATLLPWIGSKPSAHHDGIDERTASGSKLNAIAGGYSRRGPGVTAGQHDCGDERNGEETKRHNAPSISRSWSRPSRSSSLLIRNSSASIFRPQLRSPEHIRCASPNSTRANGETHHVEVTLAVWRETDRLSRHKANLFGWYSTRERHWTKLDHEANCQFLTSA